MFSPHQRTRPQPARRNATPQAPDAWPIDDEFDDFLDRHVAAIRDSLADFHHR
jgi:hypothetical protein